MPTRPAAPLNYTFNGRSPEEVNRAAIAHASGLLGSFIFPLNLVLPLILLCLASSTPWVKSQARESLNFQISVVIWVIISAFACLLVVGFFMLFAVAICAFIFPIIGACKAGGGHDYRYPLTFRLVK